MNEAVALIVSGVLAVITGWITARAARPKTLAEAGAVLVKSAVDLNVSKDQQIIDLTRKVAELRQELAEAEPALAIALAEVDRLRDFITLNEDIF